MLPCVDCGVRSGSARWLKARTAGIGASEIAGVMGISPWTSPLALYLRKIGELPEEQDNAVMEWGRNLETAVLKRFLQCHPEFREHGAITGRMYQSKAHEYQIGTPDGVVWDTRPRFWNDYTDDTGTLQLRSKDGRPHTAVPVIVEVKTGTKREGWGQPGSDEIPVHYLAQVQWLMDLMGAPVAWVPVLLNGTDYREYRVERDRGDAKIMHMRAREFWQRVQDRNPPPSDAHVATNEALKGTSFDPDNVAPVDADLVLKYEHAKRLLKRAEKLKLRYENRIRESMGDAGIAMAGSAVVARRSRWKQNQTDWGAVADAVPDLVTEHTTQVTRSRLTITGKEL